MSARDITVPTPAVPWILSIDGVDTPIVGTDLLDGHAVPHIHTLAHSLALINRFNGHTIRPYSVAEHGLLVCDIVAAQGLDCHAQMLALLHDAHEALCGDVAAPVKRALGMRWRELENPLAVAVLNAHGLRPTYRRNYRAVHAADLIALATERRDLTYFDPATNAPWPEIDDADHPVQPVADLNLLDPAFATQNWGYWHAAFIHKYHLLAAEIQQENPDT